MDTHAPEPWFATLARAAHARGAGAGAAGGTSRWSGRPLRIDVHHLYYLLLRCEGLGLPVGPLEERVESRPTKFTRIVPAEPERASVFPRATTLDDVRSIFSLGTATPWASDPDGPFRQLYAHIQRVAALEVRAPTSARIAGAEDMPGDCATPLHAFRALEELDLCGVDPSEMVGWERLCIQLRALRCTYMQLADITDLFVGLVRRDWRGAAPGHELPAAAWHALRYVDLSHNELTFVPESALAPLSALTHLDLSSNLLNAVPPALADLPALRTLSVADNMVDSVLGIYAVIPHVRRLSLRGNRLESLCGLERLAALTEVDLRDNRITDTGEVGRLAQIPGLASVWVTPNPLTTLPRFRTTCLALLAPEHPQLALDGRQVTWLERRLLLPPRPPPAAAEARVASGVRAVTRAPEGSPEKRRRPPAPKPAAQRSPTHSAEQLRARMERLRGAKGDDWLRQYARDAFPQYDVHAPAETSRSVFATLFCNPIGTAIASAALVIGGYLIWWRFFRRIPNTAYITPAVLRHRRTLVGRVTSVGDADGFRLYHTPGIPFLREWLHRPPTRASELRHQTLSVRLAGADAPEAAHFGREAQPFSKEARAELVRLVQGKTVWLDVAHLDQYHRLVATAHVFEPPYIFGRTNVALRLVELGLATVYRSAGAAYGEAPWLLRWLRHERSGRARLERAEARARLLRRGMWSLGKRLVTPKEYKAQARA